MQWRIFRCRRRTTGSQSDAELIVVGKIKEGSVEYVARVFREGEKTIIGFVPSARLFVTELAAGELKPREITVWFRGGTMPLVDGTFHWDYGKLSGIHPLDIRRKNPAKGSIQFGTRTSGLYLRYDIKDLREDHVWLLKSATGLPGLKPDERAWSVDNWESVARPELKDYYLAYRAADPKKALLAQIPKHPDYAEHIGRYVDYLEAQEMSRIHDPGEKAKRLLPLLFHGILSGVDDDNRCDDLSPAEVARGGLIECGEPAARLFLARMATTEAPVSRRRMIDVLGRIAHPSAVDALVRLLKENNDLWNVEKAKQIDPGNEAGDERRLHESFLETQAIVQALAKQTDPRSRPILEETLKQWQVRDFGRIADACRLAIRSVDGIEPNE